MELGRGLFVRRLDRVAPLAAGLGESLSASAIPVVIV
jgi:hypothetical protein